MRWQGSYLYDVYVSWREEGNSTAAKQGCPSEEMTWSMVSGEHYQSVWPLNYGYISIEPLQIFGESIGQSLPRRRTTTGDGERPSSLTSLIWASQHQHTSILPMSLVWPKRNNSVMDGTSLDIIYFDCVSMKVCVVEKKHTHGEILTSDHVKSISTTSKVLVF